MIPKVTLIIPFVLIAAFIGAKHSVENDNSLMSAILGGLTGFILLTLINAITN